MYVPVEDNSDLFQNNPALNNSELFLYFYGFFYTIRQHRRLAKRKIQSKKRRSPHTHSDGAVHDTQRHGE